jgi:hypothetical protein
MSAYKMFSGGKGGASGEAQGASGSGDMIASAMKVYKTFAGGKTSGATGGGNMFGNIGSDRTTRTALIVIGGRRSFQDQLWKMLNK